MAFLPNCAECSPLPLASLYRPRNHFLLGSRSESECGSEMRLLTPKEVREIERTRGPDQSSHSPIPDPRRPLTFKISELRAEAENYSEADDESTPETPSTCTIKIRSEKTRTNELKGRRNTRALLDLNAENIRTKQKSHKHLRTTKQLNSMRFEMLAKRGIPDVISRFSSNEDGDESDARAGYRSTSTSTSTFTSSDGQKQKRPRYKNKVCGGQRRREFSLNFKLLLERLAFLQLSYGSSTYLF